MTPETPTTPYTPGNIVFASWGYDQTNIDWFKIIKRAGDWLTLQPLKPVNNHNHGTMTGMTKPGDPDETAKPIRRKIYNDGTEERGMKFQPGYGWIRAWEGQPVGYSTYG